MPSKQKSGLYRSKVKIGVDAQGKDVFKWISGKTKRDLEDARRAVEEHYISGSGLRGDRLFGEYAQEWYRVYKEPALSPSSRQSYRTALNKRLLPAFGDRNLRAILPSELQSFVNDLAGQSSTTITMVMATLRGVFKAACVDQIVEHDPTTHLSKPTAKVPAERRALTEEERKRVTATCAAHPQGAYLACMYYLGVRPGECRGLQWGDFDWENNLVHIQRDIDYKAGGAAGELKTAKSNRLIPIPDALRAILWPRRGLPDLFLFTGDVNHNPLAKTVAERLWVELMLACGMVKSVEPSTTKYREGDIRSQYAPLVTPHTLRHNYITMCWESGIDVYTTMRLVGHTSYKTTMDIYTHLSEAQMQKAKRKVGKMFNRNKVAQKLHKPHQLPQMMGNKKPETAMISGIFRGTPSGTRTLDTLIKRQGKKCLTIQY